MIDIVCDFETRSRVALSETNTYKYARHSSTEVLCLSYSIDGGPIHLWRPDEDFPFWHIWPDVRIIAFNAEFELVIWNFCCVPKYGWPELEPEYMDCLQARSAYAGLPRNLEDVSKCLGMAKEGKDKDIFERGGKVGEVFRPAAPEADLAARVAQLEGTVAQLAHFIGQQLRPDLRQAVLAHEPDAAALEAMSAELEKQAIDAKAAKDNKDIEKTRDG